MGLALSPFDEPDDLTIEQEYARLERKYLNLLDLYRHARAAIANDIWLADLQSQQKGARKSRFD